MRIHRLSQFILGIMLLAALVVGILFVGPSNVAKAECNVKHTVQAGQNLFRISLHYGVSMSAISAANNISNINRIYVGQVLYIPCSGATSGSVGYIVLTYTPSPTSAVVYGYNYGYNYGTPVPYLTPGAMDCSGFQGTSPDAFSGGSDKFYWDAPRSAPIARYQVHILNEQGGHVRSYETLAPDTSLIGDTGLAALGEGIKFYWYVVGVTADNRICQTQTRLAQREWIGG